MITITKKRKKKKRDYRTQTKILHRKGYTVKAPDSITEEERKIVSSIAFNENEILKKLMREDFYFFAQEMWGTIIAEPPIWNWHIQEMCNSLQYVAELVFAGEPKEHDLIINVPPGSTKSTIASVMFPAWVWTRMPSARSICGSYAYDLALDLSRKCRDIVQSDSYMSIFDDPKLRLRADQNAKGYFGNHYGGMRYSMGVGGSVTGMHGHFLIVDDPINPRQAASDIELTSTNKWMSETFSSRKVDKRVSVMITIMQRLHQNDPTGYRLDNKDAGAVHHLCLPAEDSDLVKPVHLRKKYKDGLLDPIRMPKDVLKTSRADLGAFGYAGQFQQNPVPLEGGMFHIKHLRVVEAVPNHLRFKRVVRYWDKAATKDGGTYTVGVKMGLDQNGFFWILDLIRGQWDSATRERIIHTTARNDGVEVEVFVEQEPGSGGKESAEGTIRRLIGYRAKVDRVVGKKEIRADPFSTSVNAGAVYVIRAPWNRAYFDEMTNFPNSKFKDQVDASSGAYAMLTQKVLRIGVL